MIIPPDPGKALFMAKTYAFDPDLGAFTREGRSGTEARWLAPVAGAWEVTASPERRVSAATYDLLRQGEPSKLVPNGFEVRGVLFVLADDGFEAVAETT